jgi:hypothetical protein
MDLAKFTQTYKIPALAYLIPNSVSFAPHKADATMVIKEFSCVEYPAQDFCRRARRI